MNRMSIGALALCLTSAVYAQPAAPRGRYFTPATLMAQMNRPNDQLALIYLMGAYDRTQDTGRSCALRGSTTPTLLAKVFADYLAVHPALAQADRTAAGIAAQAFSEYWPCHAAPGQLSVSAAAAAPAVPASVDSQFVCPEALPNDQARREALRAFLKSVAAVRGATVMDSIYFRRVLLQKHGCQKTLQNMRNADAAVQAAVDRGDVSNVNWLPVQYQGPPGVRVELAAFDLQPTRDPRDAAEPAVEVYVKLTVPSPRETNVTHTMYDTVVSHDIFYCRSARYALIENDYFLSGKRTLKDPSPSSQVGSTAVYEIDPVGPASPNAVALQGACRGIGVNVSPAPQPGRYFTPENFGQQIARGNHQLARSYLMGVYDLTQDSDQSCAQRGTTTPTLLEKVYSDYLSAHPELSQSDRPVAGIAAQAFSEYWRCHS